MSSDEQPFKSRLALEPFSIKPPRGTHDLLPSEVRHWQTLESAFQLTANSFGYQEIRIPVFEHTELFKRGVGETTDIVNKEMYSFKDKSDRMLTLRPEGTAGVVRAFLNGGLHRKAPPVKLWYAGPMFRYESTKTGRQRQFHQLGVEAFGIGTPIIDAEVILLALHFLQAIGVERYQLQLNSIGDSACRTAYRELLRDKLRPCLGRLCTDCQDRFERNPLRMLDCKVDACQAQYRAVPVMLDHLCSACREHWDGLTNILNGQRISYEVNPRLVRGLDYYTRTVMEIVSDDSRLGAQGTICAGGRYDQLVETFGGPSTAGLGWAAGVERLSLLTTLADKATPMVFVVSSNTGEALRLATALRDSGVACEFDLPASSVAPRSFTKQLQQADRLAVPWVMILGDEELKAGMLTLKNMRSGRQTRVLSPLPVLTDGSGSRVERWLDYFTRTVTPGQEGDDTDNLSSFIYELCTHTPTFGSRELIAAVSASLPRISWDTGSPWLKALLSHACSKDVGSVTMEVAESEDRVND